MGWVREPAGTSGTVAAADDEGEPQARRHAPAGPRAAAQSHPMSLGSERGRRSACNRRSRTTLPGGWRECLSDNPRRIYGYRRRSWEHGRRCRCVWKVAAMLPPTLPPPPPPTAADKLTLLVLQRSNLR